MRRRPFRRRPVRRGRGARPPIPPVARRRLARARQAIEQGRFIEAARIYEELARGAYAHGRIRPGIHVDLEAARCYLRGDDLDGAQTTALRASERAIALGRPGLCRPLVEQVAHRLEQEGRDAAAFREKIAAVLEAPVSHPLLKPGTRDAQQHLPGSCPACSAPLHPEALEWVAEDRVACPYCGSIVVAE